jgi:adenylate cyclase
MVTARSYIQRRPICIATLAAIYNRHRQHIWSDNSIRRGKAGLERAGLYNPISVTPAVCFVDRTGFTRLTEELGDEAAARLATTLATFVDDISRQHDGRPVRWLGDGGMFHFKESTTAFLAALEMVETAPTRGVPPTHIGIEAGPVISHDGDIYGRTVNIAARIAARAQAGEVLTSADGRAGRCNETSVRAVGVGRAQGHPSAGNALPRVPARG